MKTAKPVAAIEVFEVFSAGFDDINYLKVPCLDGYDSYKALPAAVEYDGKIYGKTGWNSDQGVAYYSSGRKVATEVK